MNATASVKSATRNSGVFRILHISDLHFGRNFQEANWGYLQQEALRLQPDLIVVTGDLVNSPWRARLKTAAKTLTSFATSVGAADAPVPVRVVPGNHDTRFFGLVPINWLWLPIVLLIGVALAIFYYDLARWEIACLPGVLGILLLAARLAMTGNLQSYFPKDWCDRPQTFCNGLIGLLPLDSATAPLSFARGAVPAKQLQQRTAMLRAVDTQDPPGPYGRFWIAALHHHPLPMPYNAATEPAMIIGNAGQVLGELTSAGVALILHGHKHQQHFARVQVDSIVGKASRTTEIAILSAGTPTESPSTQFYHGFNLIEVTSRGEARVQAFLSPPGGGTFTINRDIDLNSAEQRRAAFERHAMSCGMSCRRLIGLTLVNAFGDARFIREFRGVSNLADPPLTEFPQLFKIGTKQGLVETFVAKSLSPQNVGVYGEVSYPDPKLPGRLDGNVRFSDPGFSKENQPIDISVQAQINNSMALTEWDYQCMYNEVSRQEVSTFLVPDKIAVEEMAFQIQFDSDHGVPARISAVVYPNGKKAGGGVPVEPPLEIVHALCRAEVRIRYPRPGATYEFNWDVKPVQAAPNTPAAHRAQAMRRALDALQTHAALPPKLVAMIVALEQMARKHLGIGVHALNNPLDVALFTFDESTRSLDYLVGTHKDARQDGSYPYGLGFPGRAFKSGQVCVFRRPTGLPDSEPWGYTKPDGTRLATANDVPEQAIVAIPLTLKNAKQHPYAVLQISTDRADRQLKTGDQPADPSIELFSRTVAEMLEQELDDILRLDLNAGPGG